MKELLKQAFQAGRDFGHAMGTGRPTYGLTFDEWYSQNENQALTIPDVVGQSEQLVCNICKNKKVIAYWHETGMGIKPCHCTETN